jgi:peroxin-11B
MHIHSSHAPGHNSNSSYLPTSSPQPLKPNPHTNPITVGRDKVLRTLQYFSRFLAWYLYRTNRPQSTISPYETTKKQFGATRKLMRVGKFVEHFRAAAIASDAKSMDPVLRFTTIGRQLGYAFYMLLDNACVVSQHDISSYQIVCRIRVNE